VVEVLVGDEHEVGVDAGDRRVVELHPARAERGAHVAERIDEHRLLARHEEGRLPVPAHPSRHAPYASSPRPRPR